MKSLLLLCLFVSTALAYIAVLPTKYDSAAAPVNYGMYKTTPFGYAATPDVYQAQYQSMYPAQYMPHLTLGAAAKSTSSEESDVETTTPSKKAKKTKKPKKVVDTKKKDVEVLDPAAQIAALKTALTAQRNDLKLSYQTKLDELETKYTDKYGNLSLLYQDPDSPVLKSLEDEFNTKINDLKSKYETKDYDLISKYQMKINALLPLLPTSTTPMPTSSEEQTPETETGDDVNQALKVLVQAKIDAVQTDFKKKRNDMMLSFQLKMNDLKTKYLTKYSNLSVLYPDPASPVLKAIEVDFQTKVADLVSKYQMKEADLNLKYKTKIDTLTQMLSTTPASTSEDTEDYTLPSGTSDTLKVYIDQKVNALKLDYQIKHDALAQSYQTKLNNLTAKYGDKFVNYSQIFAVDDPIMQDLQAEFSSKVDDLILKYKLKENDLLNKYKMKMDALIPKSDTINDSNENASVSTEDITPGKLQLSRIGEEGYIPSSVEPEPIYAHAYVYEHPILRLSAVGDVVAETTTKVPTMADIYWKSFGDKIRETFNTSKTATTSDTTGVGSATNVDPTMVATTPVPATFWATYGKSIGKSFADAKTKIITNMKTTTTPAPAPIVADQTVDTVVTPATPVVPTIDPTFWDDFSKTLGDALKAKALIDSLKTTTPTPTDAVDSTVDSVAPVAQKLKLFMATPEDSSAINTATPVPTIPGIYWKTFGDKIKESFNKSKTADATSVTGDSTVVAPVPPTFWMNFGKSISKAFTDAKFKVIAATKPTTISPIAMDDTAAVDTTVPVQDLDETFWTNFGKQLDDALQAKALAKATTVAPETVQPLQQSVMSHDIYPKPFLRLAAGDYSDADALQPIPVSPGLYWKGYGDSIASQFIPFQVPFLVPSFPQSQTPETTPSSFYIPPGLYWKSYGDAVANQFLKQKAQIIDAASKIKPTLIPAPMWSAPSQSDSDDWLDADYQGDQPSGWQQSEDLQQTTNWEPVRNSRLQQSQDLQQTSNWEPTRNSRLSSTNMQQSQGFQQTQDLQQSQDLQQTTDWEPTRNSRLSSANLHQSQDFQQAQDLQQSQDLQQTTNWEPTRNSRLSSSNSQQSQDLQQSEDLQQVQRADNYYGNDDLTQQSSHSILQQRNKLYLPADSSARDDSIKSKFTDAKEQTKYDVTKAKIEQPVYDVDLNSNDDLETIGDKQSGFWSSFGQKVKDNFNKVKAKLSDFNS